MRHNTRYNDSKFKYDDVNNVMIFLSRSKLSQMKFTLIIEFGIRLGTSNITFFLNFTVLFTIYIWMAQVSRCQKILV